MQYLGDDAWGGREDNVRKPRLSSIWGVEGTDDNTRQPQPTSKAPSVLTSPPHTRRTTTRHFIFIRNPKVWPQMSESW